MYQPPVEAPRLATKRSRDPADEPAPARKRGRYEDPPPRRVPKRAHDLQQRERSLKLRRYEDAPRISTAPPLLVRQALLRLDRRLEQDLERGTPRKLRKALPHQLRWLARQLGETSEPKPGSLDALLVEYVELPSCRGTDNRKNHPRQRTYKAFLSSFEVHADGGRTLVFQCTRPGWLRGAWQELDALGATRRIEEILYRSGLDFARAFGPSFRKLGYDDRDFLYKIYLWFLVRVLQPGDPCPVRIYTAAVPPDSPLLPHLRESYWYDLRLIDQPAGELWARGALTQLGLDPRTDRELGEWFVARGGLRPIADGPHDDPLTQQALRMLHYPKTPPGWEPDEERPRTASHGSNARTPVDSGGSTESMLQRVSATLGAAWRRALDAVDAWLGPLGGPPLAPAGLPGGWAPALAPPRAPARPRPLAYVGGRDGAAAGQAQLANPMATAGAHQPFVGVVDVGQGNCNVLFDNTGRARVYYDFGYRKQGDHPQGGPPSVCVCHDPLIVISHWDGDHIFLARYNPRAYACRWLAPQQHMGSGDTREVVARVARAGGRFNLWEEEGGAMTFPWGFLVREWDPNAAYNEAGKNNTGLAIYVCVRDDAAAQTHAAGALPVHCAEVVGHATPAELAAIAQALRETPTAAPESTASVTNLVAEATAFRALAVAARDAAAWAQAQPTSDEAMVMVTCIATYLELIDSAPAPARPTLRRVAEAALAVEALAPGADNFDAAAVAGAVASDPTHAAIAVGALATAAVQACAAAQLGTAAAAIAVALQTIVGLTAPACTDLADAATRIATARAAHTASRSRRRWRALDSALAALDLAAADPDANTLDAAIVYAPPVHDEVLTQAHAARDAAAAMGEWLGSDEGNQRKLAALLRDAIDAAQGAPLPGHHAALPPVRAVAASTSPPTTAAERFVLSTGDAMLQFVAPQRFTGRPVLAGLVATHHGSNQAHSETLDPRYLPWAGGSLAARAVGASHGLPRSASRAAVAAALALAVQADVAEVTRVARATEAALHGGATARQALVAAALELASPGHGAALATVRAIVDAAQDTAVAANTADAAILALVPAPSPPATVVNLAIAEIARTLRFAAGGAAALQANAVTTAVPFALDAVLPPEGAMNPLGSASLLTVTPVVTQAATPAPAWPAPAAVRATIVRVGGYTAAEAQELAQAYFAALTAFRAEAAAPAAVCANGATPANETENAKIAATIGAAAAVGRTLEGNFAGAVELAAGTAALAALAHYHPAMSAEALRAGAAVAADGAGHIVYPYGANNSYGHPMDRAVRKWRALGWTLGLSTASQGSGKALGWEIAAAPAYEGPLRGDAQGGTLDRSALCACHGVKRFDC